MRRFSLIIAWLALVWERAVPVLWPGLAWAGVYVTLSVAGLWDAIGDPWRALFAIASLAAAIWMTRRGASIFSWPDSEALARRVEDDSGIAARPHEALTDQPSEDDPVARKVWLEHRRRMALRLREARARRPHAAWAEFDRYALRGNLALLLVATWLLAGPAATDRLRDAFGLSLITTGGTHVSHDAWVDPPAYTGRAPIFLTDADGAVEVPAGSEFVARIAGARRTPRITREQFGTSERAELAEIGDGVWEARIAIEDDASIRLRAGPTRESWAFDVIPDMPPVVAILEVPDATASGELDLHFSVDDDYGAVRQALEFRPEDDADAPWQAIEIDAATLVRLEDGDGFRGLVETARHPLAGERVTIRVAAHDAAGNTGRSPELAVTLPQRVFLDALARAVAEQRRGVMAASEDYAPLSERDALLADEILPGPAYLAEEPERRIERAPEGLQYAAEALDAISDAPVYFFDDGVVYLGLREIVHRLRRARSRDALGSIDNDLWNIALRAELGSLADAEAALRAAERALMEALARGADETELAALFEAFQEAMDNYLAALAREALENEQMAEGGGGQSMNSQALQALLDALRDAAELGDTADARQALAALSELLRNMQMQMGQGSGEGEQDDPIAEAIARALEELGDMIGEQRDIQDQTFDLSQEEGQPGGPQPGGEGSEDRMPSGLAENQDGGAGARGLADMQGALADQLQRSQDGVPGSGDTGAFDDAARAMLEAEEALREGDAEAALDAQGEALADLRDGAEALARDLLERMQDQQGEMAEGEGERDPLGRPADGAFAEGEGVEVPDEMSRARARDILQELRRRAAEAGRPQEELDYIDRLLDRF